MATGAIFVCGSLLRCDIAHSRRHLQLSSHLGNLDAASWPVADRAGCACFAETARHCTNVDRSKVEIAKSEVAKLLPLELI
jgi:hypothetical protein